MTGFSEIISILVKVPNKTKYNVPLVYTITVFPENSVYVHSMKNMLVFVYEMKFGLINS